MFLPDFDVICNLLLNRRTATWNLFDLYITKRPRKIPSTSAWRLSVLLFISTKQSKCGNNLTNFWGGEGRGTNILKIPFIQKEILYAGRLYDFFSVHGFSLLSNLAQMLFSRQWSFAWTFKLHVCLYTFFRNHPPYPPKVKCSPPPSGISVTLSSYIPFLYFLRQMPHPQTATLAALKTRPAYYQYTASSVHLSCSLLYSRHTRRAHLCTFWASFSRTY